MLKVSIKSFHVGMSMDKMAWRLIAPCTDVPDFAPACALVLLGPCLMR